MHSESLQISLQFNHAPIDVFKAINQVKAWWAEELEGKTDALNEEFKFTHKDIHSSLQKIITFEPNSKVVWLVKEAKLSFVENQAEWVNTQISFELEEKNGITQLLFVHQGLIPEFQCYEACSGAWEFFITKSLRSFIETGKGFPITK